jgi:hypothetical protein
MNPNDVLAQQQALLNQAMQNYQHVQYGMSALSLGSFIVAAFVTYLFYARLRDIADEVRKLRIAYEYCHPHESRSQSPHGPPGDSAWPEPPKPPAPSAEDAKYMPKTK